MNVPDNVIEKIQKLFALSESTNENEATLAMEKAHKLLTQYDLSIADITTNKSDIKEHILTTSGRVDSWKVLLYNAIADLNYCRILKSTYNHSTVIFIVGKEINIIATRTFLEYIENTIDRMVKEQYGKGKDYIESYKLGLALRLIKRIKELKYKEMTTDCTALVVTEEANNNEFINGKYKNIKTIPTKITRDTINAYGYYNGTTDGNKIQFNKQIY